VALQILNAGPGPEQIVRQIREAIAAALPGAEIHVHCRAPGHFEIRVTSASFQGKPRLKQHQLVYAAITDLMSGDAAPVHAVDRLECRTP
jgi:acid stress-induced BolA-like protein IbaG/YrbA